MPVPGTMGRILIADLTTGQMRIENPSDELYLTYFGGHGLGAYYLYKMQPPGVDPLGPDNTLGFFAGLLTGTGGITTNRYTVVAKSPKTGGWGDANSGGQFGPAMKGAGLDAIIVTGASETPVLTQDVGKHFRRFCRLRPFVSSFSRCSAQRARCQLPTCTGCHT